MMRRLCAAFCLSVFTLLAACHPFEGDDARICRATLPVLNPPGALIALNKSFLEQGHIHIDYQMMVEGRTRSKFVVCSFETIAGHRRLSSIITDEGALNDASLLFLQRFYLSSPEALWNEPKDAPRTDLPVLPTLFALILQHVLAALPSLAIYGLIAASYAMIYGLVGRILFGFGEFAVIGGTATTLMIVAGLISAPIFPISVVLIGIMMGLAAAAWYGLASEKLIIAPLLEQRGLPILIATMGMTIVLAEFIRLTQGATGRWISPLLSFPVIVARSTDFAVTVTPVALAAAGLGLVAALSLVRLMQRSLFGRMWRALADDPLAAALMGVNGRAILSLSFVLATGLAGLAGVLTTLSFGGVGYAQGMILTLKALTAAIVGGIGSVRGALWGGVILGLFEAFWSATMPIDGRDIAVFGVLAVTLILKPTGFFGERAGPSQPV
ncbi:MAG: branched-chain amino acid ABC transporter permease [Beijerinckiaceae bacterium]|nr:branched-chain amino acid ABC transporter permease [Beijerinckiaceae bacterium]